MSDEPCRHNRIVTYRESQGGPGRMWACADCQVRFYPACRTCVNVGHRNEDHPADFAMVNAEQRTRPDAGLDVRAAIEALPVYRYILPTDDESTPTRQHRPFDMLRRDQVLEALTVEETPNA